MLVNRKAVKMYVHDRGKQLEAESLEAVNQAVQIVLDRAIKTSGHFKRIRPLEVLHGIANGKA